MSQQVNYLETVGDVLRWHNGRMQQLRVLSADRKRCIRGALDAQLLPALGSVLVADLNRRTVERELIFPMQAAYSLAYVRKIWNVLASAFRRCVEAEFIEYNPLASVTFGSFRLGELLPRETNLLPANAADVLNLFNCEYPFDPRAGAFGLLLLLFGTRQGETRKAKWSDFKLDEGVWIIPAVDTKTRKRHELPLTDFALGFLRRYKANCLENEIRSRYLFWGIGDDCMGAEAARYIVKRISDGNWHAHDIRKMVRASWATLGVDFLIGELLLNHSVGVVAKTYLQCDLTAPKLLALEVWHAKLKELLCPTGTPGVNPVTQPLRAFR